jgi:hypothetical protein
MQSPLVLNLIDNGNNVIISLKNNNKNSARVILKTMYENVLNYYQLSQFAIQADVYRFGINSKNKFKKTASEDYSDLILDLPIPEPFEEPTEKTLDSVFIAENYINRLIKHVSKFESELSNLRTSFIVKNQRKLSALAREYGDEEFKNIIRKIVPSK